MSARVLDLLSGEQTAVVRDVATEQRAKRELHRELVASLDLTVASSMPRERLRDELRRALDTQMQARSLPVSRDQQLIMVEEILDEVLGFGPLERLLRLSDVSDILVNGPQSVWVERNGRLEKTNVTFRDDAHLLHVLGRIVARVGRRIDETNPLVDARLPDGSRVHAVIAPIALDGPTLSIRRFGARPIRRDDLVRLGTAPDAVLDLLEACVRGRLNVLVSGGTGTGKTTLLNVLSSMVPDEERIITIEDAAELQLQQPHVVRMETRQKNVEGEGEITARVLVRNALRMRPDRILVGEIRGEECIDMLQAMTSGHEGSIGTVHANSPHHVLGRLQAMVGLALGEMPERVIRDMIADAIDLIVQIKRFADGRRRIVAIAEVRRDEHGRLTTRDLVAFRQHGVDADGQVQGAFVWCGHEPAFVERLQAVGLDVPASTRALCAEA